MKKNALITMTTLVALSLPGASFARETIRIVGSSTVFPFSSTVAERFGKRTEFKTPVVESTGSGGGLKLFCSGVGEETPDIANSSRRIKQSEFDRCADNQVGEIVEVLIGYDGIVIANTREAQRMALTTKHIYLALASRVPLHGKLVPNPYEKWSEIDPSLPDSPIEVMGPPPTSGTRDAFVELAMEGGATQFQLLVDLKRSDKREFKRIAHTLREDGRYLEAGENDNLIVQKLRANPKAVGIFGFSFLDQNMDRIQGSLINGVAPEIDAISTGEYAIARSLFFYVKKTHVGEVPGLVDYIKEFLSSRAAGDEGYLADRGLIPLPSGELKAIRKSAEALTPLELQDIAQPE